MKINRFGRAEILTPDQINLLFTEGFVNPRDRKKVGEAASSRLPSFSVRLRFLFKGLLCSRTRANTIGYMMAIA